MKRLNNRAVEFTAEELAARDAFNDFLDQGFSLSEARDRIEAKYPGLDFGFYTYLEG